MEAIRVFLVEDDFLVAEMMQERLERMGYAVAGIAHTGEDALIQLQEEDTADLVLMDIDLSSGGGLLDGIETASQLLAASPLPLIYLSSLSDRQTLARAKATKALTYLLKPFKEQDAQMAIEMALANFSPPPVAVDEEQDDAFIVRDAIFIKEAQKYIKIGMAEIQFLEASKNYVIIHTTAKDYVLCNTLAYAEKLIDLPHFFRCHQSYLVNLHHIDAFEKDGVFIGPHVLPISRSKQAAFIKHLQVLKSK